MRSLIIVSAAVLFSAGCRPVGPGTVPRDRFDYAAAISDSVKSQMLLNMVKLRYGDAPVFVDVSSVISQYSVANMFSYNFLWEYHPTVRSPSVGGSNIYIDRPTITYTPLTGEKFTRSLLTPIQPSSIFSLVQSGRSVDFVFYLCVQSINGISNRFDGPTRTVPIDPNFIELLAKMRRVQQSGMIGMRIQTVEKQLTTVMYFRKDVSPEILEEAAWIKQKLGLNPQAYEFNVVYGAVPKGDNEIALLTRSVMEILIQMASAVEVPDEDIQQNRTYAVVGTKDPLAELVKVRVLCGREKPVDAFVSILYRDKWYWVEDTDFRSKQVFSGLLTIISLMEADRGAGQPVITVSTG